MKLELMKTLPLAAMLALAAPAIAQDNSGQAETPQTKPAEPALDMGEPVGQNEAAGQTYVKSVNGGWEQRCIRLPEGQGDDPCQMYQLLKDENGNPVAEISLGRLPKGAQAVAGATVVVPLETLLTQQLTISVDGAKGKRYPFRFCAQPGCIANIGFTQADVDSYKRGAKATVTITPAAAPDQRVNLSMSLTGFTDSYDALVVPTPPAQ